MSDSDATDVKARWLGRVADQLSARDGVTMEEQPDGGLCFEIVYDGKSGSWSGTAAANSGYPAQKQQYGDLRDLLTSLGIEEGASYTPPPPPKRGMTPQIKQAREKQRAEFEAWQKLWRVIGLAEKALDVEFELEQMMDYY